MIKRQQGDPSDKDGSPFSDMTMSRPLDPEDLDDDDDDDYDDDYDDEGDRYYRRREGKRQTNNDAKLRRGIRWRH